MAPPQVVQVNLFKYALDAFKQKGIPVDRFLKKSPLGRYDLDQEDSYVPLNVLSKFLDELTYKEGIHDFIEVLDEEMQTYSLGSYGAFFGSAPDVLSLMKPPSQGWTRP